jgi:hypothetical protein
MWKLQKVLRIGQSAKKCFYYLIILVCALTRGCPEKKEVMEIGKTRKKKGKAKKAKAEKKEEMQICNTFKKCVANLGMPREKKYF